MPNPATSATRLASHDLKALVIVRRHLIYEFDFPGEVFAHRLFHVLFLLARLQTDVVGRAK